jgi:uncharacterized repeat protein (TIGR03803 family)
VLHSFGKWEEGFWPTIGLAEDEAGNLFGANTGGGGAPGCNTNGSGCGVVFKLAPDGKYTVLHAFNFQTDGGYPLTRLVRDAADGDIYGTGIYGPEIFRISANGNFMFHHTQSGYYPSGLVRNANGTLFVLTEYGGSCCGAIFKVSPTWKERVVHDFRHRKVEGYPVSLTMDASGNLYGGSQGSQKEKAGAIFRLTSDHKFSVLHQFGQPDGIFPSDDIAVNASGTVFGTTRGGGDAGYGIIYQLNSDQTEEILYNFDKDTGSPEGLIVDEAGNLYGETGAGGLGYGTTYELVK